MQSNISLLDPAIILACFPHCSRQDSGGIPAEITVGSCHDPGPHFTRVFLSSHHYTALIMQLYFRLKLHENRLNLPHMLDYCHF